MTRDTYRQNSRTFLAKFLTASILGVSAATRVRTLVDESGIILSQVRSTTDEKMVAVTWDTLQDTTPNQQYGFQRSVPMIFINLHAPQQT
jgi:hypothetical protein